MNDSIEVIEDENGSIYGNYDFDSITRILDQRMREQPSKFRLYLRVFLPHFCLFASLVLYILIGAAYFYYHESAYEVESKTQQLSEYFTFRKEINDKIWILKNSNKSNKTVFRQNFEESYHDLFDDLISHISHLQNNQYIKKKHLFNETANYNNLLWSYSNSIFFATTVVSTIGYTSRFAPVTTYGRIGVVIFGLFGIPLFTIAAGDIGKFISELLILCHQKYRNLKEKVFLALRKSMNQYPNENEVSLTEEEKCLKAWDEEVSREDISFLELLFVFMTCFAINAFLLSIWKGWSFLEASYIWFNTMTTIGFGNKIPSENDSKLLILVFIIFGVAFVRMYLDLLGIQYIQKIHYFGRKFQDTDLIQLMKRKKLIEEKNAAQSMETVE